MGVPYACVYKQIMSVASAWTTWVAGKNTSALANVLPGNIIVLNVAMGKRGELLLTLADPAAVTDADAASAFSSASGVSVIVRSSPFRLSPGQG